MLMTSQRVQQKTQVKKAGSVVGAYRAGSTTRWAAATGITTKIPPL